MNVSHYQKLIARTYAASNSWRCAGNEHVARRLPDRAFVSLLASDGARRWTRSGSPVSWMERRMSRARPGVCRRRGHSGLDLARVRPTAVARGRSRLPHQLARVVSAGAAVPRTQDPRRGSRTTTDGGNRSESVIVRVRVAQQPGAHGGSASSSSFTAQAAGAARRARGADRRGPPSATPPSREARVPYAFSWTVDTVTTLGAIPQAGGTPADAC